MKVRVRFLLHLALSAGFFILSHELVQGQGRLGSVEWSDGHKQAGTISLTPGKDFRLFTATDQVSIQLADVKEMSFKPEKEEVREGFYFPNAGQATQAKTGDVYPTRSLQTRLTLSDGRILEGHLFTTTLYVETDETTEKVVLMAKQTGTDGQKLTDLVYPVLIHFDSDTATAGSWQIDLTDVSFSMTHPPVVVATPDLTLLPLQQIAGKQIWSVPQGKFLFSVEAADGIHVSWPTGKTAVDEEADPIIRQAVENSLKDIQDFYDTRTLLGFFIEEDDIYSLVMMKRLGHTDSFKADKIPWSLVLLHWKYDPDQKKATLLNRASLAMGRAEGNSQPPTVFKDTDLSRAVSPLSESQPKTPHP